MSTAFDYKQKTFELSQTDEMARAIHDEGFALIPGVLNSEEITAVRDAIDGLRPFHWDGVGKTHHFKNVFNRDKTFFDLIDRPGIIELAEKTMGEQCHIIGQSAWKSFPGHNGWSPHTDRVFVEFPEEVWDNEKFKLPVYLCTCHYYLDDLDTTLAPTWVIPGSHKSGRPLSWGKEGNPTWQGRELEPVLCKAGDVLFFRSEIWHTGSENTSDKTRYLLQTHYSHRFVAPQFSPYLKFQLNNEFVATASPRQLRLIGNHAQGAYD